MSYNVREDSETLRISDSASEDEELGQDWSQLAKITNKQLVIPKRGEKDYEPDGTEVQQQLLLDAKKAMFDTLEHSLRVTAPAHLIKGYWEEQDKLARVSNPKGSFMNSMGKVDSHGVCWLTLFEFLYLVERGSITPYIIPTHNEEEPIREVKLSIQDVYTFFDSPAQLDAYFVYAYLKRLGFLPLSVDSSPAEPTSFYPTVEKCTSNKRWMRSLRFQDFFPRFRLFGIPFYHPIHLLTHRYLSFGAIYKSINNFIPHASPPKTIKELHEERESLADENKAQSYGMMFNVWKPCANFKKRSPGLPDFQVLVYNKNDRSRPFPTYNELKDIFMKLDYKFDYLKEFDVSDYVQWDQNSYIGANTRKDHISRTNSTKLRKVQSKKSQQKPARETRKGKQSQLAQQLREIKKGYRSFILAIVDDGLISFVKLAESDFGSCNVWT